MRRAHWLPWLCAMLCWGAQAEIAWHARQSSTSLLSPSNRAMQDDPSLNPATLWLLDGQALWQQAPDTGAPACQGCHGDIGRMAGVAARYPQRVQGVLRSLDDQINHCREQRQHARPWPLESAPLLSLSLAVAHTSRGWPIVAADDAATREDREAGRRWFQQRLGQINLSCAQCHDERWGQKLGGVTIPQGHPTGYPIYRLEWQSVGSLQRRLRNCMNAVRAEPFAPDDPAWRQLSLYLHWRARGMVLETPAVRP